MAKAVIDIMRERAREIGLHLVKQGFQVDPNKLAKSLRSFSVSGEIEGAASGNEFDVIITDDTAAALDGAAGDHIALEPISNTEHLLPIGIVNAVADAVQTTWGLGGFQSSTTEIPRGEHRSTSSLANRRLHAHFWNKNAVGDGIDVFPYLDMESATKDEPLRMGLFNYAGSSATQVFSAVIFYVKVPAGYKPPGMDCKCPTGRS